MGPSVVQERDSAELPVTSPTFPLEVLRLLDGGIGMHEDRLQERRRPHDARAPDRRPPDDEGSNREVAAVADLELSGEGLAHPRTRQEGDHLDLRPPFPVMPLLLHDPRRLVPPLERPPPLVLERLHRFLRDLLVMLGPPSLGELLHFRGAWPRRPAPRPAPLFGAAGILRVRAAGPRAPDPRGPPPCAG